MGLLSPLLGTWNGGGGGGDLPPGSVAVKSGDQLEAFFGDPPEDQFFAIPALVVDDAVTLDFGAVGASGSAVIIDGLTNIRAYNTDGVTPNGQGGIARVVKAGANDFCGIIFNNSDGDPANGAVIFEDQDLPLYAGGTPLGISVPADITDASNPKLSLPEGTVVLAPGSPFEIGNTNGNFAKSGTIGININSGNEAVLVDDQTWVVSNGDGIAVVDANGVYLDDGGTVQVDASTFEDQVLLPANVAVVIDAKDVLGVVPTGIYVSKVTFSVVNGVITAITLG